ncbi:MAG: insulinase family protein, partial [Myxococcales bacterium]|nr:insulinase family protein [Myxococcales bacterium]
MPTSLVLLALVACTPKPRDVRPEAPRDAAPIAAPTPCDDSTALALDPAVQTGVLANGLTYYIRRHGKPEHRAFLWLAVDAGSVLEDDDQRGLAHFVEHMAFNGTARFEKNTIIDFFERAGMDFGADVNAFTSFDETVYMLTVPTDDAKLLANGYDVIEDWAGAVSFVPAEVEKERGVVIEEWRLGRGASQRVFDRHWPVVLAGSKYAERLPIGEKAILESAPVARLRDFYRDWYRPDNMAVVVVGDIDPSAAKREIEARFGKLANPATPKVRPAVPVPLLEETRVHVQTDPEMALPQVTVSIKGPRTGYATEHDFRDALVEELLHGMLRARLDELQQRPGAPFTFTFTYTNQMGRAVDVFNLFAGARPEQAEAAVKALLVELERVRRHGFLDVELARAKAEHVRGLQQKLAEADTVDGGEYAFGLVTQFLEGRTMIGAAAELALAERMLPAITLAQVDARAKAWVSGKDRVISAAGASRDAMPSDAALLATADAVAKVAVEPWREADLGAALMATAPVPGTIVKREDLAEIGAKVWTLSNGARVLLKPTAFKNDEVLFEAFSPGGTSLAPAKRFGSAEFAASIVAQSGVGDNDAVALRKLLTGKVVSLEPFIDELEEGMHGSASPKDLETLLQLVHLYFTAPRQDPEAFAAWKGQMIGFFQNRDLDPQAAFFDAFGKAITSDHPRRRPPTAASLAAVDHASAIEFYRTRFADADDFTFVFVGNLDEAALERHATTYLASLPALPRRRDKWRDVGVKAPEGVAEVRVKRGQDPKSFVMMAFHGPAKWSPEAKDDLAMLSEALGIRLREILREDMSGVYGVFTSAALDRRPKPEYQFLIGFGCSPENAEALTGAVLQTVATVKAEGVDPQLVAKLVEQRRRALEVQLEDNGFWMGQLADHLRHGTDPREVSKLGRMIERVSAKAVQGAARRYLGR